VIVSIAEGARRILAGELVAYPTETVYALGADATSATALARLREAKGRAADRGLSVLLPDPGALDRFAPALPAAARRLAARFWPGPLTLVVGPPHPALAGVATPLGVGFRCSSHPVAAALAREAGRPLVSTSCNRSGEPAARSAAEVERAFGPALAIADGAAAGGLAPSTVVAVRADGALERLRDGAIPFERIEAECRA
jgi:L-threonylcarbamoyladenylate synthase